MSATQGAPSFIILVDGMLSTSLLLGGLSEFVQWSYLQKLTVDW